MGLPMHPDYARLTWIVHERVTFLARGRLARPRGGQDGRAPGAAQLRAYSRLAA
jgi:hypothetical protein